MTDEQIEKALELCASPEGDCCALGCPYAVFLKTRSCKLCMDILADDALALIKRQKAEIEKLIDECGSQSVLWRDNFASVYETAKETIKAEARTEAIREFEKAVMELFPSDKKFTTISRASIMQIAREMTEEQK